MDIDSDLAVGVREKTIDYVKAKYGEDAVVGIITETLDGVKGSIQDAAKYISIRDYNDEMKCYSLGDQIRKKVPADPKVTFSSVYNDVSVYDMLKTEFQNNEDALKIIDIAKDIEGMLCGYGQHAAGVVIYGALDNETNDVSNYIPIRDSKIGRVTEMNMTQVEANGLLKMDFLGLKTLNILTDTAREIEKNYGIIINADDIPVDGVLEIDGKIYDSKEVYTNIFEKGKTKNVFQFESPGMRKMLKQMSV